MYHQWDSTEPYHCKIIVDVGFQDCRLFRLQIIGILIKGILWIMFNWYVIIKIHRYCRIEPYQFWKHNYLACVFFLSYLYEIKHHLGAVILNFAMIYMLPIALAQSYLWARDSFSAMDFFRFFKNFIKDVHGFQIFWLLFWLHHIEFHKIVHGFHIATLSYP